MLFFVFWGGVNRVLVDKAYLITRELNEIKDIHTIGTLSQLIKKKRKAMSTATTKQKLIKRT